MKLPLLTGLSWELGRIDLLSEQDKLKVDIKSMLREHQFLWEYVSQRNRNTWTMGGFFVPISFLIFAYAVTAKCPSPFLASASIFGYLAWWVLYLRNNSVNRVCVNRMKGIEAVLRERYGIDYQPITQTDVERRRHWLTRVNFPDYVFHLILLVLIVLWMLYAATLLPSY